MILYAQPDFKVYKEGIHNKNSRFVGEAIEYYPITHVEYGNPELGNEIYIHKTGLKYPTKGFTTAEMLEAVNIAKRIVMFAAYTATPLLLFKKYRNKVITLLNRTAYYTIEPYIIKKEYQTKSAKEFAKLVKVALIEFGIEEHEAEKTGEIMGCIIQNDDAYRYRLEDVFREVENFEMPKRELKRIADIYKERDGLGVYLKIKQFLKLLPFISNTKIKRIFSKIDIKNLALDEIEYYHILFRGDYKFLGLEFDQRQEILADLHNGKVPIQYQ